MSEYVPSSPPVVEQPPSRGSPLLPAASSHETSSFELPVTIDLTISEGPQIPDDPVLVSEVGVLVAQVFTSSDPAPPPFESNQQAQRVAEGRQSEPPEVDEYETPEGTSLKRKRLVGESTSSEGDRPAVAGRPRTSPISSDPAWQVAVKSQLLVMKVTKMEAIQESVDVWEGSCPPKTKSNNQYVQHNNIRSLGDDDLAYTGQEELVGRYGHCKFWMTIEKKGGSIVETPKLLEGGTNNDAPRVTIGFNGGKKNKYYIYHVLAVNAAVTGRNRHLSREKLGAVSQEKDETDAATIVHLCGHKWCMNDGHYRIRTKRYNDQQEKCHFGLQSAKDWGEFREIQLSYCKHQPTCWTINYKGAFETNSVWESGKVGGVADEGSPGVPGGSN